MYSLYKTAKWLESLPDSEKNKYFEESRTGGRVLTKLFKERIKSLQEKRLDKQRQKAAEIREKRSGAAKESRNNDK
jgi:hypothetical protein